MMTSILDRGHVLDCSILWMLMIFCLMHLLETENRHQQVGNDGKVHFAGYAVFRMVPTSDSELRILQSLAQSEDNRLDFWKPPTHVNDAVDVMVPPEKVLYLEQLLIANTIPRTIVMYDVERYIEKERLEMASPNLFSGRDSNTFFTNYRSLHEIHKYIDDLAAQNPSIARIISVGKSNDNRDLKAIKIGDPSPNSTKESIWIDGGIHAREWISPATVTYLASRLVQEYNTSSEVKELVDIFDWYILPVMNPDGYEYSRTVNRMWRKTRRFSVASLWGCTGVDLNRNFGFHWNEGGASSNPCSDIFAGTAPFSEPESKAVSDFVYGKRKNMIAFLAVHSYSQLWLTPWGWTAELPKDYASMVAVAQESVFALSQVYGTRYRIGSSTNILYKATGGADDWAHGVAGIKYTYTVELRDTGRYGFLLPSEQIIPNGQEMWAAVKAMAKSIKREL